MELVTKYTGLNRRSLTSFKSAQEMYEYATDWVTERRALEFMDAWDRMKLASKKDKIEESQFVKEFTWCVHVSGFSAAKISERFPRILMAHNITDLAGNYIKITKDNILSGDGMNRIFSVFKNRAKAKAVQKVREMIHTMGWDEFSKIYLKGLDPAKINLLPFMGPALSHQLARNLGNLSLVKPDVHLNRLAQRYEYKTAEAMCRDVSDGKPLAFVDLMIWYAAVDNGTR